jgi:hypothetical protein
MKTTSWLTFKHVNLPWGLCGDWDLPNGVQCNVVLEMAAGQPGQEVVAEPNLSAMVAPLSTILLHFVAGL